jgi:hypothetical protein
MDNMDLALLCLDETIDDGLPFITNYRIIMETDGAAIAARVTKRQGEGDHVPLQDQTISQVWKSAQEQLARSFLK